MGLKEVTEGTRGYRRLQGIARGYTGLQGVRGG